MTPEERAEKLMSKRFGWNEDMKDDVRFGYQMALQGIAQAILEAETAATAREREACAKLSDSFGGYVVAAAIRARGTP